MSCRLLVEIGFVVLKAEKAKEKRKRHKEKDRASSSERGRGGHCLPLCGMPRGVAGPPLCAARPQGAGLQLFAYATACCVFLEALGFRANQTFRFPVDLTYLLTYT